MIARILTALVLSGIVYIIVKWYSWGFVFFTEIMLFLGVIEWTRLGKMKEVKQGLTIILYMIISFPIIAKQFHVFFYSKATLELLNHIYFIAGSLFWLLAVPYMLKRKTKIAKGKLGVLIGGSTLGIAAASAADLIARAPIALLAAISLPIIADTFAYIGGKLIGKNKLTIISPKKTKEGLIVGLVCVTIFGGLVLRYVFDFSYAIAFIAAFFCGIAAVLGDLFESLAKRWAQVKDSSNLLPGHGGVLDRFDSHVAALPVLSVFVTFF